MEAVPTSAGPAPAGRRGQAARPLPPGIAAEIREEAGDDAAVLHAVATSPSYGAPASPRVTEPNRGGDAGVTAQTEAGALDAVVSPVAEADAPRFLVLLALLGGMTFVALALAVRRQRR